MHTYPLLLDLTTIHALVVGAGAVGMRKIQSLLDGGPPARITIVDPAPPCPQLCHWATTYPLDIRQRPFEATDIHAVQLVFACTPSPEVNRSIARCCQEAGILCNCAQHPEDGSFAVPATLRRGDFLLCISTGGASPALARRVRQQLEAQFGPEYGALTRLLGRIRPVVLNEGGDSAAHADLFRDIVNTPILEALRRGDTAACAAILQRALPPSLHHHIEEWCHECLDMV